ncbi:c-type cytochrome [Thalassobius vesicularis]|uniref:C-type cytochrome n=1 Tax=Thalassobius vesicularis TaxID=1294297 RepID=A0A4S3MBI7_9RHOB|nr:c-type cytochrome [Thalassobius vesicularis]THD75621.1 c-type cytochrome [Thalassobius vesicularis]
MKIALIASAALLALAAPAIAGDAAKGEDLFKKCKSCHMIVAPDGTEIQKGGKTGPNLYGVVGHTAGKVDGFKYSKALAAADFVWDEAKIAEFVVDPKAFLGDKSKMTFKLKKGGEDVAAYLASVGPKSE